MKLAIYLFALLLMASCGHQEARDTSTSVEDSATALLLVEKEAGNHWNIFGLQITGKVMSESTGGAYSVVLSNTPPGGGPPRHVHQHEDELFYVMKGSYLFYCGEEEIRADSGAMVFLPRGKPHGFKNVGSTEGLLMNTISPGGFVRFFEEIDRLPKDAPPDREKITEIAGRYGLRFLAGEEE